MTNLLTRKLELFGALPDSDRRFLDRVVKSSRTIPAQENIITEGDRPNNVHLVMEGLVCRYKLITEGRRQIMAYLVPGDWCDYHIFILKEMDHSIGTLTDTRVVDVPRSTILEMMSRPLLARAVWWMTLVDEAVLREWLVNLGQRNATERIAHLFCELHLRYKSVGLSDGQRFSLPITQTDLADSMGISDVHANRSLQELRKAGLITFKAKEVIINDLERLTQLSGFNPNYLHLDGGRWQGE
jgi:CRP-like cAMP-binding protein